ncbi:hypothetical protein [Laspinema olomoucense]|uniref:hypothetical protein n=1 Tax=Laspinema olomoucense TaxID=3231600 RepID=UPI0021BAA5EE|nr:MULTISPECIES: hypothetical protein [unclassified Laspinema]MCT7970679.1 hypothetical protein [Laspinema sp. D3d]MCT7987749.1 hypothetical protein [Laspinema sp. D3a]MCT7996493.1 hypothetical protein [Laspinema sp. D3c]
MNKKTAPVRDLTEKFQPDIQTNEPLIDTFRQVRARGRLRDRLTGLLPIMMAVYLPTFLIVLLVRQQNRVPIHHLMGDPTKLTNSPFYLGIVTKLGILLWCATAAICLFTSLYLKPLNPSLKHQQFLFFAGILTTVLMLDDFFQFHEEVFPTYLGISEKIVYLAYVIMVALYLVKFYTIILSSRYLVFVGLALVCFALSILLDMRAIVDLVDIGLIYDRDRALLENGFQLFGIVSWFTYFSLTCKEQIQQGMHRFQS